MIRAPAVNETAECLRLLYMSGPNMFSYFFIKQPPEVFDILGLLYPKSDVLFSSAHMLVKAEGDAVCGLLLSVPGKDVHMLENNIGKYFKELANALGVSGIMRMLYRSRIQGFLSGLHADDEYYISNLAVSEAFRGRGIGGELLDAAKEIAADNNCAKLSLLVELENANARKLYEKHGFKKTRTVVFPKRYQKYQISGFHKMIREL